MNLELYFTNRMSNTLLNLFVEEVAAIYVTLFREGTLTNKEYTFNMKHVVVIKALDFKFIAHSENDFYLHTADKNYYVKWGTEEPIMVKEVSDEDENR